VRHSAACCAAGQASVEGEISLCRESFARDVNSFCDGYELCGDGDQARRLAASAEIQKLARDAEQLETGELEAVAAVTLITFLNVTNFYGRPA